MEELPCQSSALAGVEEFSDVPRAAWSEPMNDAGDASVNVPDVLWYAVQDRRELPDHFLVEKDLVSVGSRKEGKELGWI